MTMRVCTVSGCPTIHEGPGMCAGCRAARDRGRRAGGNPYHTAGHRAFREAVLARDPICVDCLRAPSTDADHDPHERADLIAMGLDPNNPSYGRGRCHACHSRRTAESRPAGWNSRD